LKSTGKTQTPLQKLRAKELTELGFRVFVIDTMDKVEVLLWGLGDKRAVADCGGSFRDYDARIAHLKEILFDI
jgi:hypothetical protein